MAASITEVAHRAGVSVGTVSNVINRPELVSEATRLRVQEAIAELGFVRNESARQLRAGRSRTIGLVVLDVANPFFTDVARGAEELVAASGNLVMLCNSAKDTAREHRHLDVLEEQRVQGVLIAPVETDNPRLDRLVARGIPVVLVDRASGRPDRCSVAVDDVLGGRTAVSHLIERGHRRVAFLGGPMSLRQVQERYDGAAGACAEADDGRTLALFDSGELTLDGGRTGGEEIAALPDRIRPTAVFCGNDLVALGLLQAMTAHGLRVPADIAIVGYDDIDYAAGAAVPLTSVRQPRELMGQRAAELLLEEVRADPEHIHQQILFRPELVVRASSAAAR
jgi:DNA-binding LacI/PurR family transcriptional regulator